MVEERRGGSSKISGISFIGTAHWGYVTLLPSTCQRFVFKPLTEITGICVQEDCVWVADPKAINHILQKSGYLYATPSNIREGSALLADRGIIWAHG